MIHLPLKKLLIGLLSFCCVISAQADDEPVVLENDPLFTDVPVVLTATRLRQAQSEAPAAMTILDRELIRLSGARNVPELLRLVAGFQVGFEDGHTATISYHGVFDDFARRLQVLIDGRSVYEPALARILWLDIPLALDDIQRIEVTRGPNSAMYGANSFSAVVNIITVSANDVQGTHVKLSRGDKNIRDAFLRYAGTLSAQTAYRVSLGSRRDDGFDVTRDRVSERHDSYQAHFLQAQIEQTVNEQFRWDLQTGFKTGYKEMQDIDTYEPAPHYHDQDNDNAYVLGHWFAQWSTSHEGRFQFYINRNRTNEEWFTCPIRAFMSDELSALFDTDANYTLALVDALLDNTPIPTPPSAEVGALLPAFFQRLPLDGTGSTCGYANQNINENRIDIEFQDTWRINDQWRVVSGLSWREDSAKSETYLAGEQRTDLTRLFANVEYRPFEELFLNVGGMLEHDGIIGTQFSPRAAANYAFNAHHTLRLIAARAIRSPDMFEESGQFSYTIRDLETPVNCRDSAGNRVLCNDTNVDLTRSPTHARYFQTSQSPGSLEPERITSYEIGLHNNWFQWQLESDIKLFRDRYDELISGLSTLSTFQLDNSGTADMSGSEVELQWRPLSQLRARAAYSHVNLSNTTASYMTRSTPHITRSFLLAWSSPWSTELSSSYYDMNDYFGQRYEMWQWRLSGQLNWGKSNWTLALEGRYWENNTHFFDRDNVDTDNDIHWFTLSTQW